MTYCAVVPYWSLMSPRDMAVGMAGRPAGYAKEYKIDQYQQSEIIAIFKAYSQLLNWNWSPYLYQVLFKL